MTEHNIFHEVEADLAHQRYEELWKKYGAWIVTAAVFIVVGTAGYSAWHNLEEKHDEEATTALFDIMEKPNAAPDYGRQMGELETFSLKNKAMAQSVFAHLDAAGLAAANGKKDRAVQLYDEVANDKGTETIWRQFADLMSVRNQLDSGDPKVLAARLEPLLAEDAPWRFSAMEYTGFLAIRAGNKEKARSVFAELSQNALVPHSLSDRALIILNYLKE